ncbi:hypothetical protein WJX74_005496 [Apatococcus lobatus]|uniref:Uncharacterized protein n=1 Tax=Apatococcus lobatus TaxID=904363 RepID=A0AAW1SGC1_9CHLO
MFSSFDLSSFQAQQQDQQAQSHARLQQLAEHSSDSEEEQEIFQAAAPSEATDVRAASSPVHENIDSHKRKHEEMLLHTNQNTEDEVRRADARAAAAGLDVPVEFSFVSETPNLRKLTAKDRTRDPALLGLAHPSIVDKLDYHPPRRKTRHSDLQRRGLTDEDRVQFKSGQVKQIPRFWLKSVSSRTESDKPHHAYLAGVKQQRNQGEAGAPHTMAGRMGLPPPSFVSLQQDKQAARQGLEEWIQGRNTEYLKAMREDRFNLQLCLECNAFQDIALKLRNSYGASKAKRAEHLHRAVELKKAWLIDAPVSLRQDDKWIKAFVSASLQEHKEDHITAQQIWDRLLATELGKHAVAWIDYLQWRRGVSETFHLDTVLQEYGQAMQALAEAREEAVREGLSAKVASMDAGLVDISVAACRLMLQAGHTERGLACIQALLEFACLTNIYAASEHLEQTREHFQAFYESNAAQIGEDGAVGFTSWAAATGRKLPEGLPGENLMEPEAEEEEDPGGWSGWQELATETPAEEAVSEESLQPDKKELAFSESDSDLEDVGHSTEEDEGGSIDDAAALIEAEAAAAAKAPVPRVLKLWAQNEARLDAEEWLPNRLPDAGEESDDQEDASPEILQSRPYGSSYVSFDVIQPLLSLTGSPEQQHKMMMELLELLQLPVGLWRSSNFGSSASQDHFQYQTACLMASLGELSGFDSLRDGSQYGSPAVEAGAALQWAQPLLSEPAWWQVTESRRQFAVRVLQQCLRSKHGHSEHLCRALMIVEAAVITKSARSDPDVEPSRFMANAARARSSAAGLLGEDSGNYNLYAALGWILGLTGQHKEAAKVLNGSLLALEADSQAVQATYRAHLVHTLAEAELRRKSTDAAARALHVLCWLGCRGPFVPFKSSKGGALPVSDDSTLRRARKGFQQALSAEMAGATVQGLPPATASLVACWALLEQLQDRDAPAGSQIKGLDAATGIIHNALSACNLQDRRDSATCEILEMRRCALLLEAASKGSCLPARALRAIARALEVYPRSPSLLSMHARAGLVAHRGSRLRLDLWTAAEKDPTSHLQWLLLVAVEGHMIAQAPRLVDVLKRAVDAGGPLAAPLLHRLLVACAAQMHKMDKGRATRCLTACPGVRSLWLEALPFAGSHKPEAGIQAVRQKGLRIRSNYMEAVYEASLAV